MQEQDDQDSPKNPTWRRTKEEQTNSRAKRARERARRTANGQMTPDAAEQNANPIAPKKGRVRPDEAFISPPVHRQVDRSEDLDAWRSPYRATRSLGDAFNNAENPEENIGTPAQVFQVPPPPEYLAFNFGTPSNSVERYLGYGRSPGPLGISPAAFPFDAEQPREQPDICVTAIRNVKAFIENATANQHFDCDAALQLLDRERQNVINAMDDLDADDLESREVHTAVTANFVFMIRRIEDRQAKQEAVSQEDIREFMHAMEPPRREVVARLF